MTIILHYGHMIVIKPPPIPDILENIHVVISHLELSIEQTAVRHGHFYLIQYFMHAWLQGAFEIIIHILTDFQIGSS